MPPAGRRWTNKEVAFLRQHASTKTIFAMSQVLGRTEASVERKLRTKRLRCSTQKKPRSEWLSRDRGEITQEALERANAFHLSDLKNAGHTWWHRFPAAEADTLPQRISVPDSTFSHSSCIGSPAAMCAD